MKTLYKCEDFLIVAKPSGIHSDQLMTHEVKDWVLCHRLDLETTGCLLFCRPALEEAMRALFSKHDRIEKLYLAGCSNDPKVFNEEPHLVEGFIGSRYRSSKKVHFSFSKKDFPGYHSVRPVRHKVSKASSIPESLQSTFNGSVHQVELLSGARHQIRAYFAALGYPLVGDKLYGDTQDKPIELHAFSLKFEHPLKPGKIISAQSLERPCRTP